MTAREYARAVALVAAGAIGGSAGLAVSQGSAPVIDVGVLETDNVRALERDVQAFCGQAGGVFAQIRRLRQTRRELDITTDGDRFRVAVPIGDSFAEMSLPARVALSNRAVPGDR